MNCQPERNNCFSISRFAPTVPKNVFMKACRTRCARSSRAASAEGKKVALSANFRFLFSSPFAYSARSTFFSSVDQEKDRETVRINGGGRRIRNSGWEVEKEKKNRENGRRKIWNRDSRGNRMRGSVTRAGMKDDTGNGTK